MCEGAMWVSRHLADWSWELVFSGSVRQKLAPTDEAENNVASATLYTLLMHYMIAGS